MSNALTLTLVIKPKLLEIRDYVLFFIVSPDHNTLLSMLDSLSAFDKVFFLI